ncbi:hypothetical protein SHIRM173S_11064 [Streptomyces hirsutus]
MPVPRASRKSKRVPVTSWWPPAGIRSASTGVKREAASRSSCPAAPPEPERGPEPASGPVSARFQYEWFVGFTTVGASATASYAIPSAPRSSRVYVTDISRRPGKPSSPSAETRVRRRPCGTGVTSHTRLSKPRSPPCSEFGPLFGASVWTRPSSGKRAPAMRLAYRPIRAPKYGSGWAR